MSQGILAGLRPRWTAAFGALLLATTAIGAGALPASATPAVSTSAPATISAANDDASSLQCPDVPPDIGSGDIAGFDSNVNVYVGGDWSTTNSAAETEGLVVVKGDATFDRDPDGLFNIGVVGVGSQVPPPPGSTMLHVGGDLTTVGSNVIQVGIGHGTTGGGVSVGGTITPTPSADPWLDGNVQTAGGVVEEGLGVDAALDPFQDFGSTGLKVSNAYAGIEPTGTVTSEWGTTTLTGTGADATGRQVFELDLTQFPDALGTADSAVTIAFVDVNPQEPIVINVVGPESGSVTANVSSFFGDGVALNFDTIGQWATDTLWNFQDADDLLLTGGAQFVGSIVVPSTTGTVTTEMPGLNGRLYVGGNLVQSSTGGGTEIHSFPFDDGSGWGCKSGISLTKVVEDPSDTVPADTVFEGTWQCEVDGETVANGEWTLTDGESVSLSKELPVGSECTVTETTIPEIEGGTWDDPVISPEQPITIEADNPSFEVTVTNTFIPTPEVSTGFEITKVVDDEFGTIASDTTFSGDWACTLDGDPIEGDTGSGTWELVNGGTTTVGVGLPIGSECTVTENSVDGTDAGSWAAPVISPESVTLNDSETLAVVTVTNTFDQNVGDLDVRKVVLDGDSGLVPDGTTYSGTYECTYEGSDDISGAWSIEGSGTTTVAEDIPFGYSCAITEDATPAVDGGEWKAPVITNSPVIIGAVPETVDTVTVTNTFTPAPVVGGFEVTKSLTDDAELVDPEMVYTGSYECTVDGESVDSGEWSVMAGQTTEVASDLAVGAECSVTESVPADVDGGSWETPEIAGSPLTITDGAEGLAAVTVTNTFTETPAPVVGGFEVTKSLTDDAELVSADTVYSGTYECVVDGEPVDSGEWSVAAGQTTEVASDLPVGAECSVTESTPADVEGGSWETPEIAGSPVTITDGAEGLSEVTVTNTFTETPAPVVGGFEITKNLRDQGELVSADTEFTGTWQCAADGGIIDSGEWSVKGGETATVATDLPVGATCAVTENDAAAVEGGSWETPEIDGSPVTITDGNEGLAAVSVTNTFTETPPVPEPGTGNFQITKVLDDQTGLLTDDLAYTGDWECTLDGTSVGSGEWELHAGETVTVADDLPLDAECAVTEDELSPSAYGEWEAPIVSAPITITDAEELPVVSVTNTLTPFEPEVLPTTVPSPEPTTDVTEGPDGLPTTGSAVLPILAIAAFLLLGGAGILVFRRRKS